MGYLLSSMSHTVAVGAWGESSNQTTITNGATASANNSAPSAGAVYIFTRSPIVQTFIPTVTLTVGSTTMGEALATSVTVTLSAVSALPVTVTLTKTGTATETADYTLLGTITIPVGSLSASITLTSVNDTLDETDETVVIEINTVQNGTESGIQQQTVAITDDDAQPTVTLSVGSGSVIETNGTTTVTATLSAISSFAVTATLSTSGTATSADYTLPATITVPAGSQLASVTLFSVGDLTDELDETVVIDINTVINGTKAGAAQTVTILDDDAAPTVTLSVSSFTITEASSTTSVIVTLNHVSSLPVTVTLGKSGTAADGADYTLAGQITIPVGDQSASAILTATVDTLDENDETVIIDITEVTNGTEATLTQQQTITIPDDDLPPTVTLEVGATPIGEAAGTTTVTAVLNLASGFPVTVTLTKTSSSTAIENTDYSLGNTIVVPAGATSASIILSSIDDLIDENDETVVIDITAVANGTESGIQTATVTIADDDAQLTVSKAGTGNGTVTSNPAGITCGNTCSTAFAQGTSVTLTASTTSGSTFAGWSGGGCSGTGTCPVSMTQARNVTATFTMTVNNNAGTAVSGGIYSNATWSLTGSPYIVTGDVTFFPGYTLTIEPGVEVRFSSGGKMNIRGSLIAEGTKANPIVFDSTTPGTKGSWGGIYVATTLGGSASIKFAHISDAQTAVSVECCRSGGPVNIYDSTFTNNVTALGGYAGWAMIVERCTFENSTYAVTSADKQISNSVFRDNDYGLYETERVNVSSSTFTGHKVALYGGRGTVQYSIIANNGTGVQAFYEGFTLTNNTITNNDVGVILGDYGNYSAPVKYNNIYNNTTYNVKNVRSSDKNVPNNWWGTTGAAVIGGKIYDGYDDVSLGIVYYEPILITPVVAVVSTNPHGSATDVAVVAVISATFMQDMDPSTVNSSTFHLHRPDNTMVNGTVTYDAVTRTARFTSVSNLSYSTTYTGMFTTDIKDASGNALNSEYTWSFITETSPPPPPPPPPPPSQPPPVISDPDFTLSSSGYSLTIQQGSSDTKIYTIAPLNGFNSAVTLLNLSGQPLGVTGSFSANPVMPLANGSVNSALTITVDASVACNIYNLTVTGTSGSLTHTANLSLTVTGCGGLKGEYYDNADLTSLNPPRIDPALNFDWASGSPSPSIEPDTFSARWTGKIHVDHNETHTFNAVTDDGVRLWIDGHLVIDHWQTGAASNNGTMALTTGLHDIKMEFYENTETAMAKLYWSSLSTPYAIIPQDHLQPPDSTGNAPAIAWTGESNYTSDGLDPQTGDPSTVFTCRILYTDADGNAPMAGYPRVHILKGGVEIAGSPFAMAFVSGSYTDGAIYIYIKRLPEGTDYAYHFDAKDSTGLQAVAVPTAPTPTVPFNAPDVAALLPPASGDIDGSGRVDGFDLGLLGMAFGSQPGNANWNADADLNKDGIVDGSDLTLMGANFGNRR